MKKIFGNYEARFILSFVVKTIVALAVLTVLLGYAEVNNALHPPRIVG